MIGFIEIVAKRGTIVRCEDRKGRARNIGRGASRFLFRLLLLVLTTVPDGRCDEGVQSEVRD